MALKLSDLKQDELEYVGDGSSQIGREPTMKPSGIKLSDLHPDEVEIISNPETSPVTSATTGLIQGAVPFAAPIAGVGRATMNAITGVSGPLAGGSLGDIVEDYRSGRNQFSEAAKKAAEANPVIAAGGNIVGGLGNPLFHGADTLGKAVTAAGIQGLGQSEADLTRGEVSKAAKDVGYATLGGGLGYGVGKAVPKLWEGTKYFGKKALTTLGPSEEAITARLAGKAQSSAKNYSQLAEEMGGSIKKLQDQIKEASDAAKGLLSQEPSIPKPYVSTTLEEAKKSLEVQGKLIGPTDKQASNVLTSLKEDISQLGDNLSQRDLKTLIQKMDDNINWQDQSQNKLNNILKGIRQKFDSTLKFQNKAYEKAMEPVSERMNTLEDAKKLFSFRHVPGEGLQPTDTSASKIQTSLRENKAVTQDVLERLRGYTSDDYLEKAKDFQLANQFEKTAPNGSRRTVLGGAIGGLLSAGNAGGIGIGAGVGATLDRYGGKVLGNLIDRYVAAGNSKAFGKFAPVIEAAARKGPEALAVTGALLGRDPDFRQIVDDLSLEP